MKNKETITITVNTGLKTAVMKILSKRGQTLSGFLNVYLINFIEENKRSENKKNNSWQPFKKTCINKYQNNKPAGFGLPLA